MAERINPKKEIEAIAKQEQKAARGRLTTQCYCPHTKKGEPRLIKVNNGPENKKIYACQECQKKINIEELSEDNLKNAVDIVDRSIDIIKMYLDTTKDQDVDLLDRLAKVQIKLATDIPNAFKNCTKKNNNRRNRGRNNNDTRYNDSSSWGKPSTDY